MNRPSIHPIRLIAALLTFGIGVLVLAIVVAQAVDEPVGFLMRDSVAEASPYLGAVSRLNTAAWSAVATLSAFVAWTTPKVRKPMLLFAALTATLGADDALLLHETIGPSAGVPEMLFFAGYAVATLVLLWRLDPRRTGAVGWAYVLGAGFLAASLVLDLLPYGGFFTEDAPKLLGTLVWVAVPVLAYGEPR